jgi:methylmalonyl-CoA mutase N-terminal domain/subunit
MELTSKMVLKTATELAKAQKEQFEQISKRIESLEKAGGVSQSAPRGTVDGEIHKSRSESKSGAWQGMFGAAAKKAVSKM